MRQEHSIFRVAVPVVAAILVGVTVPAFGQTGRLDTIPAAQAAPAQSGGGTLRLSSDDAVKLALEQNLGIQIARINPQLQDVAVAQARSFWSPNPTSSLQRNSKTTAATSALAGGATSGDTGTFGGALGMNQVL